MYHVISILRVVWHAQRWSLRTVNCDVNKRKKGHLMPFHKKMGNDQSRFPYLCFRLGQVLYCYWFFYRATYIFFCNFQNVDPLTFVKHVNIFVIGCSHRLFIVNEKINKVKLWNLWDEFFIIIDRKCVNCYKLVRRFRV